MRMAHLLVSGHLEKPASQFQGLHTLTSRRYSYLVCRKNGDKYNGHIHSGQAHGMGVLAYAAGEKYKGDFKADMRSGRGVCRYPDGSK